MSYYLKGFNGGETVIFGVQAFDLIDNKSAILSKTINIPTTATIDYGNNGDFFCNSRAYLPQVLIPKGGEFSFNGSYSNVTLNPITGAFNSSTNQVVYLFYTLGLNEANCTYQGSFPLGTVSPPASTPIISSDKILVNKDSLVNLTSTACTGSQLWWNFSGDGFLNMQDNPSDTIIYKAACKVNECYNYSNEILVKVIDNCIPNLNVNSPTYNLINASGKLYFNSPNTIQATNIITPTNNVQYNAANSIILSPGFTVDSGVIFSAKIQNCPN